MNKQNLIAGILDLLSKIDSDKGEYINPNFIWEMLDVIVKHSPDIEDTDIVCKIQDEIKGMFER